MLLVWFSSVDSTLSLIVATVAHLHQSNSLFCILHHSTCSPTCSLISIDHKVFCKPGTQGFLSNVTGQFVHSHRTCHHYSCSHTCPEQLKCSSLSLKTSSYKQQLLSLYSVPVKKHTKIQGQNPHTSDLLGFSLFVTSKETLYELFYFLNSKPTLAYTFSLLSSACIPLLFPKASL